MRFHLLFEQSGVFKNVLKKHDCDAYDYDILNDFKQTDFQIDLFQEIEKEYDKIVLGRGGRPFLTKWRKIMILL